MTIERSERPIPAKKALILSGGGARGAYEAGVVSALLQHETFDIVCGTSIGALNGLAIAQGMGKQITELWKTIARRDVARLRPEVDALVSLWNAVRAIAQEPAHTKPGHLLAALSSIPHLGRARHLMELRGIFDGSHVRGVIGEIADLAAVNCTFIVGVTNLSTARGNAFAYFPDAQIDSGAQFFFAEHDAHAITAENYVDAVCASAALPPAYEPLDILCADGVTRVFADGAFTNNAPIRQAIDAGATEITAIFVDPVTPCLEEHVVHTIAHVASLMLEANISRMLELDLKLAQRINDEVRAGNAPEKRYVDIRLIGPQDPILLPPLDFSDFAAIERLMERGRCDGERYLAAERAGADEASRAGV
ncbi:MAG: patatin-like phospholipase family protein [Vulcanimicrobiaceae bacterium]